MGLGTVYIAQTTQQTCTTISENSCLRLLPFIITLIWAGSLHQLHFQTHSRNKQNITQENLFFFKGLHKKLHVCNQVAYCWQHVYFSLCNITTVSQPIGTCHIKQLRMQQISHIRGWVKSMNTVKTHTHTDWNFKDWNEHYREWHTLG